MPPKQNYRETRQRKVILEVLRKAHTHPSADEIYETARKRLPRISLATVYRNLETLCQIGLIRKLETGGTLKRFDGRLESHYHIRCTCCSRVIDAPFHPIKDIEDDLSGMTEYKIFGHHLEFVGLCPACAENPIAPGLKNIYR